MVPVWYPAPAPPHLITPHAAPKGYWPESLYTAPSDHALAFDIETAKYVRSNPFKLKRRVGLTPACYYTSHISHLTRLTYNTYLR